MNILYGLARPDSGDILLDGEERAHPGPVRRHRPRHQHGPPALHAGAGADVAENILLGDETDGQRRSSWTARRRAGASAQLGERFGFDIDPDEKVGRPVRGLAAAGRDPEGALPRGPDPGARRADRRAHAPGDAWRSSPSCGVSRTRATASSSSATSCTRCWRSPTGSRSSGAARSSASGCRPPRTRTTSRS